MICVGGWDMHCIGFFKRFQTETVTMQYLNFQYFNFQYIIQEPTQVTEISSTCIDNEFVDSNLEHDNK